MMSVGMNGSDPFGFFVVAVAAIAFIAAWVILAGSRFIQGGVVERPERVPQLYGYTVCLFALLWALASAVSLVDSGLALAAPEYHVQNQYGVEPSISSFEAFRLTYDRARRFGGPELAGQKPDTVSEAELRGRYTVYRADRIGATQVESRQALIKGIVSLFLAAGLFIFHWRWIRRRVGSAIPEA